MKDGRPADERERALVQEVTPQFEDLQTGSQRRLTARMEAVPMPDNDPISPDSQAGLELLLDDSLERAGTDE